MTHNRRLLAVTIAGVLAVVGSTGHGEPNQPKQSPTSPRATYQLDAKKSRFIIETETSGLSAMFAHDHKIEVSDFSGTVTLRPTLQFLVGANGQGRVAPPD
jgi:polyisoprenoid-binding protein YceI